MYNTAQGLCNCITQFFPYVVIPSYSTDGTVTFNYYAVRKVIVPYPGTSVTDSSVASYKASLLARSSNLFDKLDLVPEHKTMGMSFITDYSDLATQTRKKGGVVGINEINEIKHKILNKYSSMPDTVSKASVIKWQSVHIDEWLLEDTPVKKLQEDSILALGYSTAVLYSDNPIYGVLTSEHNSLCNNANIQCTHKDQIVSQYVDKAFHKSHPVLLLFDRESRRIYIIPLTHDGKSIGSLDKSEVY
jgi:hypothetical protein